MIYKELNEKYGTVLKVDIDRKRLTWFTIKSIQYLSRYYSLQRMIIKHSPSKKGWHIILCLKEKLSDLEIIAWQCILGSDVKRERYNFLRALNDNPMKDWNILFPNKVNKPISFKDHSNDDYVFFE